MRIACGVRRKSCDERVKSEGERRREPATRARNVSCAFALSLLGLVASCSDPVPPAAQGSASLYVNTVANPTAAAHCPAGVHWVDVPDATGQQNFPNAKAPVAVDGQNQMSVKCTVKDNGGSFSVSGTMAAPATNPMTKMPASTNIAFSTTISADQTAPGSMSLQDWSMASPFTSTDDNGRAAPTCMFSVHPLNSNDQLAIAAGRVWMSVTCPKFRDPQSPDLNEVCSISSGIIVLENCQQ
jgi:hypothetical protein